MSYDRDDNERMVEVEGEERQDRDASWAVFFGDFTEDSAGREKEIWVFLPKSKCEKVSKTKWLVPEWLAQEKELI